MKIKSQDKKSIVVELSPIELDILRSGSIRERNHRRQEWEKVSPRYPEELMYHALMCETSGILSEEIFKAVKWYRDKGVLK